MKESDISSIMQKASHPRKILSQIGIFRKLSSGLRFLIYGVLAAFTFGLLISSGCSENKPVKIGFIGGLSGKAADLGVAGRNGVQLAIEEANAAGGISGRKIELLIKDTKFDNEAGRKGLSELLAEDVSIVIGPMTSARAMALKPLVDKSKTILLSPTVTTVELEGLDDNFLRVISVTRDYSKKSARYQFSAAGARTAAVVYDISNRAYTESWLKDYRKEFEHLGGKVISTIPFESKKENLYSPVAKELLLSKPDIIVIITNAVDSAMLCQNIRKINPKQKIAMSEWASTERFIELAGESAEGVIVSQFLNRNDKSEKYMKFLSSYRSRFGQDPGFAGVAAYDAALVAIEALTKMKKGDNIKSVILTQKSFQGVQQKIEFDRFGDASRSTFVCRIENGKYIQAE